jgi:hypothetical protein
MSGMLSSSLVFMASGLFDLDLSGAMFGNTWFRGLRSSFCVGAICQTE